MNNYANFLISTREPYTLKDVRTVRRKAKCKKVSYPTIQPRLKKISMSQGD